MKLTLARRAEEVWRRDSFKLKKAFQNFSGFNVKQNWDQVVSGKTFGWMGEFVLTFCEHFVLALLPFPRLAFLRRPPPPPPPRSKISRWFVRRDARNQDLEGRTEQNEPKVGLGREGGRMGWDLGRDARVG